MGHLLDHGEFPWGQFMLTLQPDDGWLKALSGGKVAEYIYNVTWLNIMTFTWSCINWD